jgi:glycerol-3-phosphate responsive antiterminator
MFDVTAREGQLRTGEICAIEVGCGLKPEVLNINEADKSCQLISAGLLRKKKGKIVV